MNKTTLFALAVLPAALLSVPTLARADVNQPEEIIDRPRTLPAGETEVNGTLDIERTETVTDGVVANSTAQAFTIGAGLGVTKDLEVRLAYQFAVDSENKTLLASYGHGDLRGTVAYALPSSGPLSMAVNAGIGLFVDDGSPDPLTLGLDLQYKLTSQLAVFTPGQQLSVAFSGGEIGSPFIGGFVGVESSVNLTLPIGVRFQAANNVFAFVATDLADLALHNGGNSAFLFSDFIPLQVGGFYSLSNKFDVGANINFFDLKNYSGLFDVGIVVRAFI